MVDSSINPQALAEQSRIVRFAFKTKLVLSISTKCTLYEQSNERLC
jgi:hypothetical protein